MRKTIYGQDEGNPPRITMKILYLSHHREESGFGRWCKSFLDALKTTDLEITSHPIILGKANQSYQDVTESISLTNIDVVIQNVLPHFISKVRQKCVGTAILESKNVDKNIWGNYLELLDEVWYPHYCLGMFKKEREILTPINTDKINKEYPKIKIDDLEGTYKFYWIGEMSKRKNLSGLIKAYFNSFSFNDPVSLVLKVHNDQFDSETCFQQMQQVINDIKMGMKLYEDEKYYPRIKIISDYWPKEQIYSLHKYCDCFVSASHGESICYPMLDAMLFNNPVLSTATFATESYAKYGLCKISYSDNQERCFGQVNTFSFYQSSREFWPSLNESDFVRQMQQMASDRPVTQNDLSELSYQNVGRKIKEILCEVC